MPDCWKACFIHHSGESVVDSCLHSPSYGRHPTVFGLVARSVGLLHYSELGKYVYGDYDDDDVGRYESRGASVNQ